IPEIPLTQDNVVGFEFSPVDLISVGPACNCGAAHIHSLEMCADEDRSRSRCRSGKESLGTPEKKIMANQPAAGSLFARSCCGSNGATTVLAALKMTHDAQPVGTDLPAESRCKCGVKTFTDGI